MYPPQGTGSPFIKTATVTFAFGSTLFDAAATSDSAVVWQQPANTILLFADMTLDVAFVATGLTDVDITLGDGGDNDGLLTGTMDLQSDSVGTTYNTKGAYFDATTSPGTLYKASATNWTGYVTSVGANLSTLTAGQVTFTFIYIART